MDDLPPILAPAFAEGALPSMFGPPPLGDAARIAALDALPPVLAPPDTSPQTARLGALPAVLAPPVLEREMSPETARLGALPSLTATLPFPSPVARRRRDTLQGIQSSITADPPSPRGDAPERDDLVVSRRPTVRMGTRDADAPSDRLCDLLHQAQALATALSFEERPATMMLLVRAAVYRAVYEYGEAAPDAIAFLFRIAAPVTRVIWPSAPGKRPTTPIPMAEPALLAMERIVSSRAQVPKERPYTLEPLATATQAREHLGRYVDEIELSPIDPTLRHFLALGALTELLCRSKLPAQTSQRLKDIVAHALRDGPKPATIDLMMTALKRIVAG